MKFKFSEIAVKFRGRKEVVYYTLSILELLKTDPDVEWIIDPNSGEALYIAK